MDATRIIAIRHGETAWNVDTRIQGQLDIPLNDTGRWQAQRLARALAAHEPIDVVYTSDLLRAWETARAVSEIHRRADGRRRRPARARFWRFPGQDLCRDRSHPA